MTTSHQSAERKALSQEATEIVLLFHDFTGCPNINKIHPRLYSRLEEILSQIREQCGQVSEDEIEAELKNRSTHWRCGFMHCWNFLKEKDVSQLRTAPKPQSAQVVRVPKRKLFQQGLHALGHLEMGANVMGFNTALDEIKKLNPCLEFVEVE